jgi:hypothetical protein
MVLNDYSLHWRRNSRQAARREESCLVLSGAREFTSHEGSWTGNMALASTLNVSLRSCAVNNNNNTNNKTQNKN